MKIDYKDLWLSAIIDPIHKPHIASIASICLGYWSLYTAVKDACGIPEYVTACLDYRESDFDHTCYLANGDPLFNSDGVLMKTIHAPKGLGPCKSWVDAAVLSLQDSGLTNNKDWSIAETLFQIESYNGLGYQDRDIYSPYLWSGTNLYKSGKYIADYVFDPNVVDKQMGCVPILRALQFKGIKIQ